MAIRYLAIELYRLERAVDDLTRRLEQARGPEREKLELELMQTRAERNEMRARLEAKKDPPPYRRAY